MTLALVAYCSKRGSTMEIAEWIGADLREAGVDVDVRPANSVKEVAPYDLVILGGALYMGRWHRDARRFARRHARMLRTRPVWLFSSGPLDDSAGRARARDFRRPAPARRPRIPGIHARQDQGRRLPRPRASARLDCRHRRRTARRRSLSAVAVL